VTADRLFQAVHFDEQGRMTSKATIVWELWRRLAFEAIGSGRYRFRPEFGDSVRHSRQVDLATDFWAEVAHLAGWELCTLWAQITDLEG
jgi:hypothetical protein